MRLDRAFRRFSRVVGDAAPVWSVAGVDVTAIAFLPAGGREALAPSGFDGLEPELAADVDLLLGEGTPAPPTSFAAPREFAAHLGEQQHRGALALIEPTAYLDRDERIVQVEFGVLGAHLGAGFVRRSTGLRFGVGAANDAQRVHVTIEDDFARIEHWQRFSLDCAADTYGRHARADHAPLGWLSVTYLLGNDGSARAWCASSYLPSAWFYRDHLRMHRRELAACSEREISAVLRPKHERASGTVWTCLDASTHCVRAVA
jgi:hypothetical protein